MSNPATSTWRVKVVTEKPGVVLAELDHVEGFKPNPDYDADVVGGSGVDEFIEAHPTDPDAEWTEIGAGRLTLDITDGPELHPNDNVILTVEVIR